MQFVLFHLNLATFASEMFNFATEVLNLIFQHIYLLQRYKLNGFHVFAHELRTLQRGIHVDYFNDMGAARSSLRKGNVTSK